MSAETAAREGRRQRRERESAQTFDAAVVADAQKCM